MPFGAKKTSFYSSIFMKSVVWWRYSRDFKYSTWNISEKNLGSLRHTQPPYFTTRRLVTTQNFRFFQAQKCFFSEGELKKNFLPKDAYRVTQGCAKRSGVGGAFLTPADGEKHFTLQNGRFWNNPQIGFWLIGCRGCVGARQKCYQNNFRPWRYFLIPWSLLSDPNSSIYKHLE